MLISSIAFAFDAALAKTLSAHMDSIEIVFFRNLMIMIFLLLSTFKKPIVQEGGKPWLLMFRGLIGFISMVAYFYNIAHISLADAMTFSRTSPIFVAILAFIFFKEKIGFKGWIAVFVGFVGIVFIMKPSGFSFSQTDLFGLISGLGAAMAYTSIKELNKVYDTRVIVLAFVSAGVIFPITFMLLGEFYHIETVDFMMGNFIMPRGVDWALIFGMGILGSIGQLYMTKAFASAKAGIVGAASYSVIFFSLVLGVMLGDALPDFIGVLGILLVIFSGIIIAKEKE